MLVGTEATNTLRPCEGRVLVMNLCTIGDVLAPRKKHTTKIHSSPPTQTVKQISPPTQTFKQIHRDRKGKTNTDYDHQ